MCEECVVFMKLLLLADVVLGVTLQGWVLAVFFILFLA